MMKASQLAIRLVSGSLLMVVGMSKALSCSGELDRYLYAVSKNCVPIAQCMSPVTCRENNYTGYAAACKLAYSLLNQFLESKNQAVFKSIYVYYDPSITFLLQRIKENHKKGGTFSPPNIKTGLVNVIDGYNSQILSNKSEFCPKSK